MLRAMQATGRHRRMYRMPEGLSIFTAHNYNEPSLFEQSLDFLGVEGYRVLNKPVAVWSNSKRIRWFMDYLENECRTPLVLHCDANDVILQDDPRRVVEVFHEHDCELLYCSTRWPHGYKCIPEIRRWADAVHPGRYLNGGVFIGRREFVMEVYSRVLDYVTDDDPESNKQSHAFYQNELAYASGFPRGVGCDQAILRCLEPEFYPRLKVDGASRLAWRNDSHTRLKNAVRSVKRSVPETVKTSVKRLLGREF